METMGKTLARYMQHLGPQQRLGERLEPTIGAASTGRFSKDDPRAMPLRSPVERIDVQIPAGIPDGLERARCVGSLGHHWGALDASMLDRIRI
eukprot:8005037-Pyramimonas_sp.AAC.1